MDDEHKTREQLLHELEELRCMVSGTHAAKAIEDARQQLLEIIDFLPDATFVIDSEKRVVAWNRAIEEMTGIPKKDILGKGDYAYSLPFYGDRRPVLIDLIFNRNAKYPHGYDFILKKGDTLYAEVFVPMIHRGKGAYLWVTASPLYDSSERLIGAIESIRDVSYHKRTEEALRREKEYVDFIVSTATNLICCINPDGITTSVNQEVVSVTGYEPGEIIGHDWWRLFYPGEEYAQVERFFECLGKGPLHNYEMTLTTKHREKRVISWNMIKRCESGGDLAEVVCIGTDITELKHMQEELHHQAEKIKRFAYSVSHDLKSPIIGITGLTRLLHRQYKDMLDEKGRKYCEQILKSSEQATALVEEINQYIKARELPLFFETVKPKEILRMIRGEFDPLLNMRQIEWKEPEQMPPIVADRLSLSRIFRNLVDNALKYGGEPLSKIEIGYDVTGEYHVFSIHDNGMGIKAEGCEKIFDLFQRNESSRGVEGTGLGLAIVKELVEKHQGMVSVESGPESGTTFSVSISRYL